MMKNQKKIMLLGGLKYLLPVIEAAHKNGYYVITVDYIPDNIAHKYSDEYHNVSILDKDAVLSLAQNLNIDGILSFAVDPGVVTAAFVAEKMNLPFQCSYDTACILQDKSKFRNFLEENGFNTPNAKGYSDIQDALNDIDYYNWPVIVKPVDSAGSKGVSRVDNKCDLPKAIEYSLTESHSGHFIIEDFLEKEGCSSDTDSFSINGKFVFCSFSDQLFDSNAENPYTPSAYSWPSTIPINSQIELKNELQRLADLLHFKTGVYNIETRLCKNGKSYIMEVSPRGGGNRLCEMLKYVTGVDLINNVVRSSVNDTIDQIREPEYNGYLAELILHSEKAGVIKQIEFDPFFNKYIVEKDMWVKQGDRVDGFSGANKAIGTLVLHFDNRFELEKTMSSSKELVKIVVE